MEFKKIFEIPKTLNAGAIERALKQFVDQSHTLETKADPTGLYNQILESIAAVLIFKQPGRWFWLAEESGEVVSFALTHIAKDVDNQLCYWKTSAWVTPTYRHTEWPKKWNAILDEDARANFCKHIIIPASREPKAYCRFLGEGWHTYVILLKKDLN